MITIVTLSELESEAESFRQFKRDKGHPYSRDAFEIDRFLCFLVSSLGLRRLDPAGPRPFSALWAAPPQAVTLANEFGVIRQLCLPAGDAIRSAMCPSTAGRR
ncbi:MULTISPECIES: hypothetical protein [unclassified Mesorhizobium]|uniref:hypothetical protein n=1 Tax=unclassified Mesorhizobium TaxID=325217 RepID=UPI001926EC0E|nr:MULTISPECIES: hypothetical protein [unclassified Mesorhizobium]BCG82846.1 hypothetical protein MesoLj113b_63880 [Mesorhizobium sp. 113-3-3]BCG90723.1 hypothetical protein MesoLj113c_68330 [Mesorhizobium sp. 113-3-9]